MNESSRTVDGYQRYVMPTYAPTLVLVKGKGTRVWDAEGKVYLDFGSGLAVNSVGHCHRTVTKAIREQAAQLMHVSNLYYNEKQPMLAKRLSEKSLGGKCFFCNSGAEANETLIKLARLWGKAQGKHEILCVRNSFHGRTLSTMAATGQDKVKRGFDPIPPGFAHADLNDIESCRAQLHEKTAAILVEPIQGEGGVFPAKKRFMEQLQQLCQENELLLLCDEVQSGLGRTGNWFGYQAFNVKPDAISLAKGLGGGFPIGAVISGPRLADVFEPGRHGTTFGGTPLACASALAVLDVIEQEHLVENAAVLGEVLRTGLEKLVCKFPFVTEVRGKGLMVGLQLDRPAKELETLCQDQGLLAIATASSVLRLLPPLNVSKTQINKALRILTHACAKFADT